MAMYESFFGFTKTPFSRDIKLEQLFELPGQKELISRLIYVAERRLFGLITGEVGSGKTTAIRSLSKELPVTKHRIIYVADSNLTPRNFYWAVLHQFGVTPHFYRGDAKRQLHKVILGLYEDEKKIPVIIIDESHLLSREMLEEIRFLTNFQMDSFSPMGLILVGQPELKKVLKLQVFEAIMQRVNIRFHLSGMDEGETRRYIIHHLKICGVHNPVFTDEALHIIYEFTQGIPRKINNVCSTCLLSAFSQKKNLIDDYQVKVVLDNEFAS